MSNIVGIEYNRVTNTASTDFPGYSSQGANAWDVERFRETFDIQISSHEERELNFDMIGIDTSLANAFRRIMIAEVPAVAPEYVYIQNNTSVIQDEVLAHRIGLVPLKVDPEKLERLDTSDPDNLEFHDKNTIVMTLNVKCTRNPDAPKECTDPTILYNNAHVYARDLKFEPHSSQVETFADCPVVPCDPDILLAKLRPGQEISLSTHCILGEGKDHAKFSPVATASYRLLPHIEILEPITGDSAKRFQACFPKGVIGINENGEAYVLDPRKDTVSREVLRHEEFEGKVKLGRVRDHFVFNVESTGAMQPEDIVLKSIDILKKKAEYLKKCQITQ